MLTGVASIGARGRINAVGLGGPATKLLIIPSMEKRVVGTQSASTLPLAPDYSHSYRRVRRFLGSGTGLGDSDFVYES